MSLQIPEWFVQQYSRNVMMLVQQQGSRLRGAVTIEPVNGKSAFIDRLGATAAILRVSRHADSPLVSTPHSRRRLDLADYEWGDLVDQPDKIRTLNDPTSPYAVNASWAMGRSMDDVIIVAFDGTAFTGSGSAGETVGTVTFPAGQSIANDFQIGGAGSAGGMTLDKLLEAKRILDSADVPPDEERFLAVTARQLQDMLNLSGNEITSADFNTVRALVRGEVDTFLGFTFIRTERLSAGSGTDRNCMAWTRSGMALGIGQDIRAEIERRADKSFSTYVFYSMSIGAVRLEEERVVRILCQE